MFSCREFNVIVSAISISVSYRIFQFSVSSIVSLCRLEVILTFSLNFIVNLSSSYSLIIAWSSNLRLLRVLLLAVTEIYYVELDYEHCYCTELLYTRQSLNLI